MSFQAPVKAMQYLLRHGIDLDAVTAQLGHEGVDADMVGDILSGASAFASDVLAPTNWNGDQSPAELEDGNVTTSPGFKEAYTAFVEAGWQTVALPEELGGMGLPQVVSVATNEMIYAANMALGLAPMLTSSAVKAIAAHGTDEQRETYLPKMVTGEWSGAMCLTEPQAGSDLSTVRTKAVPNGDGSYAISGQKIYITWGDHDCADNIIHLVLARLPDAPEGTKGISLFLCPKMFVNADGSLGERNGFRPIGLEHKLGIHGSPTCTMEFEKATGWLVGEENRGLACMFTMMNEARLFVGVQGVAIGERAYQAALQYAHDRVQGVPIDSEVGAPIVDHPDVRRMLVHMKTRLMGARAINMATAAAADLAEHGVEGASKLEQLLTPISKAYGSDIGVEAASIGVQVHGGMGFVEETGAAQHYRDARIAPIYEGTNGIQAIDLVGRKLRRDGGEGMRAAIHAMRGWVELCEDDDLLEHALRDGLDTLSTATDIVLNASDADALAGAAAYLELCGLVMAGAYLTKAAMQGVKADDPGAEGMTALARYHAVRLMPEAKSALDYLRRSSDAVFDVPKAALADL